MTDNKKDNRLIVKVFRSNKAIYGQAFNDGIVIAEQSTLKYDSKLKPIEAASKAGQELAGKIKVKKFDSIIFDRNGYRYHGRVKALAEGLRTGGIKF